MSRRAIRAARKESVTLIISWLSAATGLAFGGVVDDHSMTLIWFIMVPVMLLAIGVATVPLVFHAIRHQHISDAEQQASTTVPSAEVWAQRRAA